MQILVGNLLLGVAQILHLLLSTYIFLLFGRVIISWVNADPYNPLVRFLVSSTEPPLALIRQYLPRGLTRVGGALDLTPLFFLMAIYFLDTFLVTSLMDFGLAFKRGM
jgi:YggT family protein